MAQNSFLSRERIIAKPGFNRWLVPPAALSIHLCIGQIYAYSAFNKPLEHLISHDIKTPDLALDWGPITTGWIFSIALCCLSFSRVIRQMGGTRGAKKIYVRFSTLLLRWFFYFFDRS